MAKKELQTGLEGVEPKPLPHLSIEWDERNHRVRLNFDPDEFKSWDFIIALMEMGKLNAETHRKLAQDKVRMEQIQSEELLQALKR